MPFTGQIIVCPIFETGIQKAELFRLNNTLCALFIRNLALGLVLKVPYFGPLSSNSPIHIVP